MTGVHDCRPMNEDKKPVDKISVDKKTEQKACRLKDSRQCLLTTVYRIKDCRLKTVG